MGLYKEITTDAGSTLSYWDYGIVEVNTSASKAEDHSANVIIFGYNEILKSLRTLFRDVFLSVLFFLFQRNIQNFGL